MYDSEGSTVFLLVGLQSDDVTLSKTIWKEDVYYTGNLIILRSTTTV